MAVRWDKIIIDLSRNGKKTPEDVAREESMKYFIKEKLDNEARDRESTEETGE